MSVASYPQAVVVRSCSLRASDHIFVFCAPSVSFYFAAIGLCSSDERFHLAGQTPHLCCPLSSSKSSVSRICPNVSIPHLTFYMQKCAKTEGKGVHARGTCRNRNGLVSPQGISSWWMASKSRGRTISRTTSTFRVRGSGHACYQAHALYRPNILKIKPFAVC